MGKFNIIVKLPLYTKKISIGSWCLRVIHTHAYNYIAIYIYSKLIYYSQYPQPLVSEFFSIYTLICYKFIEKKI